MSEILAAVLYAQLEEREYINGSRMNAWNTYNAGLEELERQGKLKRPTIPKDCEHNAHIYYIRVADEKGYKLIKKLASERKVGISSHYLALHLSPGAAKFGKSMECPEAAACASSLLRLPVWVGMTEPQLATVIAVVRDALLPGPVN